MLVDDQGDAMFDALKKMGFDVYFTSHAEAIVRHDFSDAESQLEDCLKAVRIDVRELVGSGGGEASITQTLRGAFRKKDWNKHNFKVEVLVDGRSLVAQTHEIDHVRTFAHGTIAMEIEWNNKDPFFDRDLENFRRLHSESAISLGVIITRGTSLQSNMVTILESFFRKEAIAGHVDLEKFGAKTRTARQASRLEKALAGGTDLHRCLAEIFVSDKYGSATTHWEKLMQRVGRGVGKPCPLVLIGIPSACVEP